MKRTLMILLALLMLLMSFNVMAIAEPTGPNVTGNPSHGDDWGGGCSGEGNYGSGQPPMGPDSADPGVIPPNFFLGVFLF